MVSKLHETKYKPSNWRFTFSYTTKKKPLKRIMRVKATQYMKKKGKDIYTGQMIGKRY